MKYKLCRLFTSLFFIFQFGVLHLYGKVVSAKCNPYYASIKSNKVRAHVGPGQNYKLVCEYISKGLPVMITAKYDHWRRVVDPDGTESWVHKSLLSSKRRVISRCGKYCELRKDSNDNSPLIAYIKKNVIMELVIVRGNWCKIEANFRDDKYVGWIKKENLFGVLDNETS